MAERRIHDCGFSKSRRAAHHVWDFCVSGRNTILSKPSGRNVLQLVVKCYYVSSVRQKNLSYELVYLWIRQKWKCSSKTFMHGELRGELPNWSERGDYEPTFCSLQRRDTVFFRLLPSHLWVRISYPFPETKCPVGMSCLLFYKFGVELPYAPRAGLSRPHIKWLSSFLHLLSFLPKFLSCIFQKSIMNDLWVLRFQNPQAYRWWNWTEDFAVFTKTEVHRGDELSWASKPWVNSPMEWTTKHCVIPRPVFCVQTYLTGEERS